MRFTSQSKCSLLNLDSIILLLYSLCLITFLYILCFILLYIYILFDYFYLNYLFVLLLINVITILFHSLILHNIRKRSIIIIFYICMCVTPFDHVSVFKSYPGEQLRYRVAVSRYVRPYTYISFA